MSHRGQEVERDQFGGNDVEPRPLASLLSGDEAGVAQDLQVVRNGGLRPVEVIDEVADAHTVRRCRETAEDLESDRVGDGFEAAGEQCCVIGVDDIDRQR